MTSNILPQAKYRDGAFICFINSVTEHLLEEQWFIGSIPPGRTTEPFLVPATAPQMMYQRTWYVLVFL